MQTNQHDNMLPLPNFRSLGKVISLQQYLSYSPLPLFVAGMAQNLDHLAIVQRVPGSKTTFRQVTKCEKRIFQLSPTPGKRLKGVVMSLITSRDREQGPGPGRTAR